MVQLLERFIVAFEKIAAALSGPQQHGCGGARSNTLPDGGVVVEQLTAAPPTATPIAQTAAAPAEVPNYKGVTDYDTLRRLCQDRKIAVPPRTKTTTLVKWLQQDDLAKATPAAASAAPPVVAAPVVHTDPPPVVVAQPPTPVEADPFQEPPPAPAKEITLEDVIEIVTRLKGAKGLEACKRVVIEYGGATLIKDIPKDKFATVYAAAQKELE